MASVLVAVEDKTLAAILSRYLEAAGHTVVAVRRALAVLSEAGLTQWDVVFVDSSDLGRDTLIVVVGFDDAAAPIIGIGFEDLRLSLTLPLPLSLGAVSRALDERTGQAALPLVLRPDRRVAQANGREVRLTSIEFRLLEALLANRPGYLSVTAAIENVWGRSDAVGTPAPLRSHVRNLRLKLGQLGLPDSLRSRRGRGYSLAL